MTKSSQYIEGGRVSNTVLPGQNAPRSKIMQ